MVLRKWRQAPAPRTCAQLLGHVWRTRIGRVNERRSEKSCPKHQVIFPSGPCATIDAARCQPVGGIFVTSVTPQQEDFDEASDWTHDGNAVSEPKCLGHRANGGCGSIASRGVARSAIFMFVRSACFLPQFPECVTVVSERSVLRRPLHVCRNGWSNGHGQCNHGDRLSNTPDHTVIVRTYHHV